MSNTVDEGLAVQVGEAPQARMRTIFRRFWPDTRPFRGRMLLSLLLVPVSPALTTASIYLFKVLVDNVLTPHDYRLFVPVALAYLGLTVAGGLVGFVDEYLTAWVGEKFVMSLRIRVFAHLQRVSIGWFERHQLGDVLARLTGDISAIEQLVLTGVNLTLTYAFQAVFFAGTMFVLNWQLTLASLAAAPAFLLLSRTFSRRIQAASRERRRRSGSINAVAEENLANLALVQAYDRADAEVQRFATENRASFSAQMLAIRLEALFEPFSSLVEALGVLVVSGVAVYELAQGTITLGGLLAFLAYLGQLYAPVQGFAGLANTLYSASASAERILELLNQRPGVIEPVRPHRLDRAFGAIHFERVSFTYPGAKRPALHEVDLHLAPGRKIAIVGASGAGKSTLTKLLLRSYDPHHGRILLDGHDLRELDLSDLRRNISAVLQETLVFDGTVAENIRWGKPDATDAEVRAAAKAADAHEFIMRLDHRYDTRVGQRGRLLSGGQRQRLAIARAMIRDAPVLLLDEPTTGLDAASGQRVLAPLRRLMAGRTTIVISHDLLTVTDADAIVVLEAGAVRAIGSHARLLATSPIYADLYALHHPAVRSAIWTPQPMDAAAAPTRPFRFTGPAAPALRPAPTKQAPPPRLSVRRAAHPPPGPPPSVPSQVCPRPPVPKVRPMSVLLQLAATTPLPALRPQRRHLLAAESRPHTFPAASTIPLPRVPPSTTPVLKPPTQHHSPGASGTWTSRRTRDRGSRPDRAPLPATPSQRANRDTTAASTSDSGCGHPPQRSTC
jgi:ATP-binding cassette, subfamily B, bacterial